MTKSMIVTLAPPFMILTSAFASTEVNNVTELIQTDDWDTLKNIWQMANNIKLEVLFPFPMATPKGDSILVQLNSLFPEPFQNSELNTALQFTQDIVALRISKLSRMNYIYLTRMMPPWTDVVQDEIMFSFESRLTELDSLVKEKEITVTEFIAARDSLILKAETIAILELVNQTDRNIYRFAPDDYNKVNVDVLLEQLDLSYRAALDTLEQHPANSNTEYYENIVSQHEVFLERYNEFREAKPIFQLLLTNLIEPLL